MSETQPSPEELHTTHFAQLVMQQANLAFMLLGKTPHPETGKAVRDLDGARMFIDQLEMLEAKTRGNLSATERDLLQQSLMSLRLAFVAAVDAPAPAAVENKTAPAATADAVETEATGKRFTKAYPA
jgi:hypothetical protein